jgi:cysteinyl-tRNA synthetase, unknown class
MDRLDRSRWRWPGPGTLWSRSDANPTGPKNRSAGRGYMLAVSMVPWLILLAAALQVTWWDRVSQSPVRGLDGANSDRDGVTEAGSQMESLPAPRRPWGAVHNWAYWLNGPRLGELGATKYELVVIDFSKDGSSKGAFSTRQIEALRHSTCERRVVAYLSIGQAEDFRSYWRASWNRSRPAWIIGRDPDWEGAYWVRYWDDEWQQRVYQYLDQIIAQGFDGIYLDRVDAYEESYARGHERDMVDFVLAIARYARARSPLGDDFGVIVQNAADLGGRHADYLAEVTGIGQEEAYVAATNKVRSSAQRAAIEAELNLFRQTSRGRLVLTVDYADTDKLVQDAYQRSRAARFVPYVTDVELDRLTINPGYEPTCHPFGQGDDQ